MTQFNDKKSCGLSLVLLVLVGLASTVAQGSGAMTENEQTIRKFVAAWSNLDSEELAGYFAENGIYHNMPSGPVQGRAAIQTFIAGFIRPWQSTEWEIVNLIADGNKVIVERVDRTVVAGRAVDLPCFGYFELREGKIVLWRDYFDLTTYTDALSAALGN